MSSRIAVVDIRSRIDIQSAVDLLNRSRSEIDSFYSFSALSSFILDRCGLEYKTLGDLIDFKEYNIAGVRNFQTVNNLFNTLYEATPERWGCYYYFKIYLDNLCREFLTRTALVSLGGEVEYFVDITPFKVEYTITDYLSNRFCHYLDPVDESDIKFLNRRKNSAAYRQMNLRRYLSHGISKEKWKQKGIELKTKIKSWRGGDTILCDLSYDWVYHADELSRRFVLKKIPRPAVESTDDNNEYDGIEALLPPFVTFFPNAVRLLRKELKCYDMVYRAVDRYLQTYKGRIRGAIVGPCVDYYKYASTTLLKKKGMKIFNYQHGAYYGYSDTIRHHDLSPATHNFVFGNFDAESGHRSGVRNIFYPVGSIKFQSSQTRETLAKSVLFVLNTSGGNCEYFSNKSTEYISPTSLWNRYKKVISMFSRFPEFRFLLKASIAEGRGITLYTPLREYISQIGAKNISVEYYRDIMPLLEEAELVILDYISTTILEVCSSRKRRVVVYGGRPFILDRKIMDLFGKIAKLCFTEHEYYRTIKEALENDEFFGAPEAFDYSEIRRQFLIDESPDDIKKRVLLILGEELRFPIQNPSNNDPHYWESQ